MTRDELIQMARDAGAIPINGSPKEIAIVKIGNIEQFAKLVAEKEREACAQICDHYDGFSGSPMNFAYNCSEAIRARGKK